MMPIQPLSLEREQSRIAAMKARNAERASRFLNHKQRTMGIDVEALGQQLQEKKEKVAMEKRESIEEGRKQAHIMQTLDSRDKERDDIRRQEAARLRDDWQAAKKEKDERKFLEKELGRQPIGRNVYGTSAVQTFSGEDLGCKERKKAQQMRLRQWVAEQQKFKAELKAIEAEEEARYINMDAMVCQQQLQFAKSGSEPTLITTFASDAKKYRKAQDKEILRYNARLAEEKAVREKVWKEMQANEEKMELRVREGALKEVKGKISYGTTGRMMCDRFKGLTDAEIKAIHVENQKVHEERLMRKDDEIASERAWAISEEAVLRQMEATEAEREANHTKDLFAIQEHLKAQREEAKLKHIQSKADRFGRILPSEGYYAGFETSCR